MINMPDYVTPDFKTLSYIRDKYNLDLNMRSPIEIPNVGRDDLALLFAELGFKSGAEIGVEQGMYTEVLCKANPQAKIYAVDAWQAYSGYRDHVSQDKLDGFYEAAKERMTSYNCELVRKFSMDALDDFQDKSLDFIYIDSNHELQHVVNDLIEWAHKVHWGGIVSGHDYRQSKRFDTRNHVVFAVNAYVASYRVRPWFILGRRDRREGEVRDDARSWFWVKSHA